MDCFEMNYDPNIKHMSKYENIGKKMKSLRNFLREPVNLIG